MENVIKLNSKPNNPHLKIAATLAENRRAALASGTLDSREALENKMVLALFENDLQECERLQGVIDRMDSLNLKVV